MMTTRDKSKKKARFARGFARQFRRFAALGCLTAVWVAAFVLAHADAPPPVVLWERAGAHTGEALVVAYSLDGKTLASGGADGLIRLWEADTGEALGTLTNGVERVTELWFRANGTLLSWDASATLRHWRLFEQTPFRTLSFPPGARFPACQDGRGWLAASWSSQTTDTVLEVWEVDTGRSIAKVPTMDRLAVFSPDGSELAALDLLVEMYRVRFYNTTTWLPRQTQETDLGAWPSIRPVYSADGGSFMCGTNPELWDVATGKRLQMLVTGMDMNPDPRLSYAKFVDGKRAALIASGRAAALWAFGLPIGSNPLLNFEIGPSELRGMALSADSRRIAFGMQDGSVMVVAMPIILFQPVRHAEGLFVEWRGGDGPYQVQRCRSLDQPLLEDVGAPVTEPQAIVPLSDPAGFYRVRYAEPRPAQPGLRTTPEQRATPQ